MDQFVKKCKHTLNNFKSPTYVSLSQQSNEYNHDMELILEKACTCILDELREEEKHDQYHRTFEYHPKDDIIKLVENTEPSRILEKNSIQLLTEIHLFKWCEVNDSDWVIIS